MRSGVALACALLLLLLLLLCLTMPGVVRAGDGAQRPGSGVKEGNRYLIPDAIFFGVAFNNNKACACSGFDLDAGHQEWVTVKKGTADALWLRVTLLSSPANYDKKNQWARVAYVLPGAVARGEDDAAAAFHGDGVQRAQDPEAARRSAAARSAVANESAAVQLGCATYVVVGRGSRGMRKAGGKLRSAKLSKGSACWVPASALLNTGYTQCEVESVTSKAGNVPARAWVKSTDGSARRRRLNCQDLERDVGRAARGMRPRCVVLPCVALPLPSQHRAEKHKRVSVFVDGEAALDGRRDSADDEVSGGGGSDDSDGFVVEDSETGDGAEQRRCDAKSRRRGGSAHESAVRSPVRDAVAAGDGQGAGSDSDSETVWDFAPPPAPAAGVVHYLEHVPCPAGVSGNGIGSFFAVSGPNPRVVALLALYEQLDGDALFDSMTLCGHCGRHWVGECPNCRGGVPPYTAANGLLPAMPSLPGATPEEWEGLPPLSVAEAKLLSQATIAAHLLTLGHKGSGASMPVAQLQRAVRGHCICYPLDDSDDAVGLLYGAYPRALGTLRQDLFIVRPTAPHHGGRFSWDGGGASVVRKRHMLPWVLYKVAHDPSYKHFRDAGGVFGAAVEAMYGASAPDAIDTAALEGMTVLDADENAAHDNADLNGSGDATLGDADPMPPEHTGVLVGTRSVRVSGPDAQKTADLLRGGEDVAMRSDVPAVHVANITGYSTTPVSEYTTEGYYRRSLACLFPDGRGDPTAVECTAQLEYGARLDYLTHLLTFVGGRFQGSSDFLFSVGRAVMRYRCRSATQYYLRNDSYDIRAMDAAGFRELVNREGCRNVLKTIDSHLARVVGTDAWMVRTCRRRLRVFNDFCLERHGRVPTFFDTFSFADVQSAGLARTLVNLGRLAQGASTALRMAAIARNPAIAMLYFDYLHGATRILMQRHEGLLDWIDRIEQQHRGTDHVHAFRLVRGAMRRESWNHIGATIRLSGNGIDVEMDTRGVTTCARELLRGGSVDERRRSKQRHAHTTVPCDAVSGGNSSGGDSDDGDVESRSASADTTLMVALHNLSGAFCMWLVTAQTAAAVAARLYINMQVPDEEVAACMERLGEEAATLAEEWAAAPLVCKKLCCVLAEDGDAVVDQFLLERYSLVRVMAVLEDSVKDDAAFDWQVNATHATSDGAFVGREFTARPGLAISSVVMREMDGMVSGVVSWADRELWLEWNSQYLDLMAYFHHKCSAWDPYLCADGSAAAPLPDVDRDGQRIHPSAADATDIRMYVAQNGLVAYNAQLRRHCMRHECDRNGSTYCHSVVRQPGELPDVILCRFGFKDQNGNAIGKPLRRRPRLVCERGDVRFEPARNDPFANACGDLQILMHRANVDRKPIFSGRSLDSYATKYVTKAATRSEVHKKFCADLSVDESTAAIVVRRHVNRLLGRDTPQSEMVRVLVQPDSLFQCSRLFATVSARTALLDARATVGAQPRNPSAAVVCHGEAQAYENRGVSLSGACLQDTVSWFNSSTHLRKGKGASCVNRACPLNGRGVGKRGAFHCECARLAPSRRARVVCSITFLKANLACPAWCSQELYYLVPHAVPLDSDGGRSVYWGAPPLGGTAVDDAGADWCALYEEWSASALAGGSFRLSAANHGVIQTQEQYSRSKKAPMAASPEFGVIAEEPAMGAGAGGSPASALASGAAEGYDDDYWRREDEGWDVDGLVAAAAGANYDPGKGGAAAVTAEAASDFEDVSSLDSVQAAVVTAHVRAMDKKEQFLAIVTGGAGSGKSSTMRACVKELTARGAHVVVVAPTGVAAINVGGSTLHAAGLNSTRMMSTENGATRYFYRSMGDADLVKHMNAFGREVTHVFCDEFSFLCLHDLNSMHRRLQELRLNERAPFGGVSVTLWGDPLQLGPPIGHGLHFMPNAAVNTRWQADHTGESVTVEEAAANLYRGMDNVFILEKNYRQEKMLASLRAAARSGGPAEERALARQEAYVVALANLAKSATTLADLVFWTSCHEGSMTASDIDATQSSLVPHLYFWRKTKEGSKRVTADAHNKRELGRLNSPLCSWQASHTGVGAASVGADKAGGLEPSGEMKIGSRLGCTHNLDTKAAVGNGTLGEALSIVGYHGSGLMTAVVVLWDEGYLGIPLYRSGVELPPHVRARLVAAAKVRGISLEVALDRVGVVVPRGGAPYAGVGKRASPDCKRTSLTLKPAWALTVHKSQGMEYFACIVHDVGANPDYTPGLSYVALSRCATASKLLISSAQDGTFDPNKFLGGGASKGKQHSDAARHHEVFTRLRARRDATLCRLGLVGAGPVRVPLPPQVRQVRVFYRRVFQAVLNDYDGMETVKLELRDMTGPRRSDGWAKLVEIERADATIFSLDADGKCLPQRHRTKVPGQEKELSFVRDGDLVCYHCGDMRVRCVYMVVVGDPERSESVARAPEAALRLAVPDYETPGATAELYRSKYSVWGAVTVLHMRRLVPLAGSVAQQCLLPEAAARARAAACARAAGTLPAGVMGDDGWLASEDDVRDASSASDGSASEDGIPGAGSGSDGSTARKRGRSVDLVAPEECPFCFGLVEDGNMCPKAACASARAAQLARFDRRRAVLAVAQRAGIEAGFAARRAAAACVDAEWQARMVGVCRLCRLGLLELDHGGSDAAAAMAELRRRDGGPLAWARNERFGALAFARILRQPDFFLNFGYNLEQPLWGGNDMMKAITRAASKPGSGLPESLREMTTVEGHSVLVVTTYRDGCAINVDTGNDLHLVNPRAQAITTGWHWTSTPRLRAPACQLLLPGAIKSGSGLLDMGYILYTRRVVYIAGMSRWCGPCER
ncbi:MAG: AAA family ATPase, partial [Pontimonas sp.]